jgi:hypothetical protein
MAGFHGVPTGVIEKTGQLLVTFELYRPGNGITEIDRFHFINPASIDALRNVLHRPVTPKQS